MTRRCDKGYGYALFNWDSMFAAWMLGLETDSLALGLSHFVQAVQGRTERGFFASFFTGKIATRDKGQPPIASRAALELYRRHGDQVRWALELLWPTLCSNNDFFWDTRRDPTTDLVRLGSDPGFAGRCAGRCLAQDLQHARYDRVRKPDTNHYFCRLWMVCRFLLSPNLLVDRSPRLCGLLIN